MGHLKDLAPGLENRGFRLPNQITLLLAGTAICWAQATIRVPADRSTIQAAILASSTGDTILVSPGTYHERIDFSKKAVTLRSASGPSLTIIDGGQAGPVVSFTQGEGAGSVIQGFTIQGGNSANEGGGINVQGSSPTILSNWIVNNKGCSGAGIGVGFGSPWIQGNTISNNFSGNCSYLGGGGIEFRGASTGRVLDNVISGNSIIGDGGGIVLWAGGAVTIRNNIISGNTASANGGGIATVNDAQAIIVQNLIVGNMAGGVGGLSFSNPPASLINNTIADNQSTSTSPAAISGMQTNFNPQLRIVGNLIIATAGQSALVCGTPMSGTFLKNDVFSSGGAAYSGPCIDQTGTSGNISADPKFNNPSGGNYRLQSTSPAIAAGDPTAPELPAADLDSNPRTRGGKVDMGAYDYPGPTTVTLSSTSLVFATQDLGTSSAVQVVTLTNTGSAPLQVVSIVASGDFSQVNTCSAGGSGIPAGGTCIIGATFTPTARGSRSGNVTIVSNSSTSPDVISLGGFSVGAVVSLSSNVIAFPNQLVESDSAPQELTVTNTGDAALVFASIVASPEFNQTNGCSFTIAPGSFCTISVVFRPIASGTRTGALTLTDNAVASPQVVNLVGNGQAPVPTLTAVSPSSVGTAGAAFTLTVSGTGFIANSVVRWNNANRPTTFVNSGQLTAAISSDDLANGGLFPVTVFNGPPGGGESSAINVTVNNQVPVTTSISPLSALVGGTDFQLTVNGANFVPGSVVRWNGNDRATTFVSRTQLRAAIPAIDISFAGTSQVTVFNPAPGGGSSVSFTFSTLIPTPTPVLTAISPTQATAGDPDLMLTVTGGGFVPTSVVQWRGAARPTTFVSDSQLQAAISAADIAFGGSATVRVANPSPGGGFSVSANFTILGNPLPFLSSLTPTTVFGGASGITLTISGSGFVNSSVVRWNGQDRPTTIVSATQLTVAIPASDLAAAGTGQVTVFNPPPGGGASTARTVTIATNSAPVISSLLPSTLVQKNPSQALRVSGSGFNSTSVVRWNGQDRPTTLIDSSTLSIILSVDDLATPGLAEVRVFNPPLGGGVSASVYFAVTIGLTAKGLVYDKTRGVLYASAPSSQGALGNRIIPIDPKTGMFGQPIFVGSEPGKMAISSDDSYLYVSLDGSAAVRRVDLASQTAGLQFALGSGSFGPLYVDDMEVMPGNPRTVAVSRKYLGVSPRHAGVAIYDDGVKRSKETQTHTGSDRIEFSSSPSTMYGFNNETTEFGFRILAVDSGGVTETTVFTSSPIGGFGADIKYENGRIYGTSGSILNPDTGTLIGKFTFPGGSFASGLAPDSAVGRVFVSPSSFSSSNPLSVYDPGTFTLIGALNVPGLAAGTTGDDVLVRWGEDGLALRGASQIFILRSPAVKPPVSPAGATVDAASFRSGPVAPGSLVSSFGSSLASMTLSYTNTPLPTSLGGINVLVNGIVAPLTYVSPTQVNFQVPWELAGKSNADLSIGVPGFNETSVKLGLADYAPGIFMIGGSQGAVLIGNTAIIPAPSGAFPGSRPANRGEIVSIFCTGLGPVTNQPATGAASSGTTLSHTTTLPTVTIGGQPAVVSFAGLAPGYAGLYQVNAEIPLSSNTGDAVAVALTIGGVTSNSVTVAVR